jgi:uncharacterized protein
MMGRVLFFVLLALAVYLGWRWMKLQRLRDERSTGAATSRQAQAMVSCATCGLHLPRQEALAQDERFFCCEEHRRGAPPR